MRRLGLILPALGLVLAASACDRAGAMGDANSIIVATPDSVWAEIQDSVVTALEPTILTVRRERTFRLTHQDPNDRFWSDLRKFRQVLVIGSAEDPWVEEALPRNARESLSPPEIVQARNVWARGQLVTLVVLPQDAPPQAVYPLLDTLHQTLDRQYREYALSRMYVSGHDTALATTLRRTAGFWLDLPQVYQWDHQDSIYRFRNDNPDPSELIREIVVTWRTPIPPEPLSREALLEWRGSLADQFYSYPQVNDTTFVTDSEGELDGRRMRELQAAWMNPPDDEWPAAGPFMLRTVACPGQDRLYYLDGWLYAPGRDKYEYMIQLETILDSFRCADD